MSSDAEQMLQSLLRTRSTSMNFLVSAFCLVVLFRAGEAFCPSRAATQNAHSLLWAEAASASSFSEDALEIQRVVGLTDAELKRIVSRVPQVNDYSSSAASTCVDKLKEKLSLSDLEFKKKLVLRLPQCLGYDFASEIDPSLSALQASLDMSGDELRSLVLKCPQIIGLDFSSEVEPKIAAIRNRLGGDDKSALKEEILKKPASLDLPVRGGASPSKKT